MSNQRSFILEAAHHGAMPQKRSIVLLPTDASAQQNVLGEALLEATSAHQKRHPLKWAVSLVAHVAVLGVLLLLPLYFSQGLDLHRFNTTLLTAPLPPAAPPPPPPAALQHVAREIPRTFTPGKLTAPAFVPKVVAVSAINVAPPDVGLMEVSVGIPGGVAGGQVGGVFGGTGPVAPPPATPVSTGPKVPVRVGGLVKPPQLLSGPQPVYPILAKQSHIQGVVVIDAIIDEHGNVIGERAISGHPLLVPAALRAVAERKYEPTVLDGEATQVDLRVEITFHMG